MKYGKCQEYVSINKNTEKVYSEKITKIFENCFFMRIFLKLHKI